MHPLEQALLDELKDKPGDPGTLMAYHDWLIDQGRFPDAASLADG